MSKGNCYEANFIEFMARNNSDEVLVHAMREVGKNSEWWGGHAFILNKSFGAVYDLSNSAEQFGIDDKGIHQELIYKEWNIQKDGRAMYFEYTRDHAKKMLAKHNHFGSWELKHEDWRDEQGGENWGKYMTEYFKPTHQPKQYAFFILKQNATSKEISSTS